MQAECLLCTWKSPCASDASIYLILLITLDIENYYHYFIDKKAKGHKKHVKGQKISGRAGI